MRLADRLRFPLPRLAGVARCAGQLPPPSGSARTPGPDSPRAPAEKPREPAGRLEGEAVEVELPGLSEAVGDAEPGGGPAPVAEGARELYPSVDDVQRAFGVAWSQVAELEPRVETLLGRARTTGAHCRTWADVGRVFGPLRNELAGLIGFAGKHQRHPVLGSDGAYEVAYWKLYDAVAGSVPGGAGGAEATPANQ